VTFQTKRHARVADGRIQPAQFDQQFLPSTVTDDPTPVEERTIVMSVSVCLSVRMHIPGTTRPNFTKFSACMLPMAVALLYLVAISTSGL